MPVIIKDRHTVSLQSTCSEALYTLYTAEKPCFVCFTSLLYWIYAQPESLLFKISTKDNLYSAKQFISNARMSNHIHLSGCAYLNKGEVINVYATASQTASDDIYTTLMVIPV